jgi:hypothetical protein
VKAPSDEDSTAQDPLARVSPAWDAAGTRLTAIAADLRTFFRL